MGACAIGAFGAFEDFTNCYLRWVFALSCCGELVYGEPGGQYPYIAM
jgi:hypothetical protein